MPLWTQISAFATLFQLSTAESVSLKDKMQAKLDEIAEVTGYGFSLGYIDDKGEEFGLGAGPRSDKISELNGGEHLEGTITGDDMMPIGSATKGFNCAAIYRLVD